MTQHKHDQHKHGHEQHRSGHRSTPLHKNWVTWLVVALMLAAMIMYVLSDDESIQPGAAEPGPPVDAAP